MKDTVLTQVINVFQLKFLKVRSYNTSTVLAEKAYTMIFGIYIQWVFLVPVAILLNLFFLNLNYHFLGLSSGCYGSIK